MEFEKRKIHMDRISAEAQSQITIEDDINLLESKPDVTSIKMYKGHVYIEEMSPAAGVVYIKGTLCLNVLYYTTEDKKALVSLEGNVAFEEKIRMEGVTQESLVDFCGEVQDLTVNIIHSRKLRVQALIGLNGSMREIYEESLPIDTEGEKDWQTLITTQKITSFVNEKREMLRVKEEVPLPAGYPNVYRILWWDANCVDMTFRGKENRVEMTGEINLLVMYETEEESAPIRIFETRVPCKQEFEVPDCMEGDGVNIKMCNEKGTLHSLTDADGEERILSLDWSVWTHICVYREEDARYLSDVYSTTKELQTKWATVTLKKLMCNMTGKIRTSMKYKFDPSAMENRYPKEPILQLLLSRGQVLQTDVSVKEQEISLEGVVEVKAMYVTGNDENPYDTFSFTMPFEYHMESEKATLHQVEVSEVVLEELQLYLLDNDEVEAKVVLSCHVNAFDTEEIRVIDAALQETMDGKQRAELAGIIIHFVQPGETLWEIGKKYYVSVDRIKQINELTKEEPAPGQKLLIMRNGR